MEPLPPMGEEGALPPLPETGTDALPPEPPVMDETGMAPPPPMEEPSMLEAPTPIDEPMMAPPPPPMPEKGFVDHVGDFFSSVVDGIADMWDGLMETIQRWMGNEPVRMPAPPGPDDMPAVPVTPPVMEPELGPDGMPLPPEMPADPTALPTPDGLAEPGQMPALPAVSDALLPPPVAPVMDNTSLPEPAQPAPVAEPEPEPAPAPVPAKPKASSTPATTLKTEPIKEDRELSPVDPKTNKSVPLAEVGNTDLPPLPDMIEDVDANSPAAAMPTVPAGALPELPALPSPTEAVAGDAPAIPALPEISAPVDAPAANMANQLEVVDTAPAAPAAAASSMGTPSAQIPFTADEKQVPEAAKASLSSVAESAKADANKRINVVAFASGAADQASAARRISLARALATRAALIDLGVDSLRINVQAKGNEQNVDRVDVFVE